MNGELKKEALKEVKEQQETRIKHYFIVLLKDVEQSKKDFKANEEKLKEFEELNFEEALVEASSYVASRRTR